MRAGPLNKIREKWNVSSDQCDQKKNRQMLPKNDLSRKMIDF